MSSTYEAIVKGHNVPTPGVPESFKVLVKELQSLCLDIQVLDKDGNEIELKEDEDALDTFNLARMDADDERQNRYADDNELADAGFGLRGRRGSGRLRYDGDAADNESLRTGGAAYYELRNI